MHTRVEGLTIFYTDTQGCLNKYALVQYWFDGPPVKIRVKPHGNSNSSAPYFRTAASAKIEYSEIAASNTPKSAVQLAIHKQGGELEAKGFSKLPRNVQQMKNLRRSGKKKDSNVLYSVMLQCKLSQGKDNAYVRDVQAAPEPQCVLFYDWQIADLTRFLTNPKQFSVFSADTTYNLGDFYVTPTVYQHIMLEDIQTGKHPYFLGPILVHHRKDFSAFNHLGSSLICHSKKLREIQAFGTDGDPALIEALSHNFPSAKQLRCFIHLKRNITEKLKERGIPSFEMQEFIADIFGKQSGSVYQEGLVDSNKEDFDTRLENCTSSWIEREARYRPDDRVSFFDYFSSQYARTIRHTMLKDLRTSVGLGLPPAIYTTNACESFNAVIKRKINYKETEWPSFNDEMKQLVDMQRDEAIRALSGRGEYRLCENYRYLKVEPQEWIKMSPDQRKKVLKQFDDAGLHLRKKFGQTLAKAKVTANYNQEPSTASPSCSHASSSASTNCTDTSSPASTSCSDTSSSSWSISITHDKSGISSLPQAVIEQIWTKAEQYLMSNSEIVKAPGNDTKAMMVASRSGQTPHYVRCLQSAHYVCDNNCLQWKSAQICSHVIAVSEKNGQLHSFLEWYKKTEQQPNITSLAVHGLPAGRGHKGGIPKKQRSTTRPILQSDVIIPRPATCKKNFTAYQEAQHMGNRNASQSTTLGSPSLSQSASHTSGVVTLGSLLSQNQVINVNTVPTSVSIAPPPNTNPFFLRAIEGNIRMCQGCKTSLRNIDGSVPQPPYDLSIARYERRVYRDKNGILQSPQREQPVHYHFKLTCIHAVTPDFVPSSLTIPPDILPRLNITHKEYLRLMFGLS